MAYKLHFLLLLAFTTIFLFASSSGQDFPQCSEYLNCSICVQNNCSWCNNKNQTSGFLCELQCNDSSASIVCSVVSHNTNIWQLALPIAVYLGATLLLFIVIKSSNTKRARILAMHARRTEHSDFSAFGDAAEINKSLQEISEKEQVLWSDVSTSSSKNEEWKLFVFCVVVMVAGGIPIIYFCIIRNYIVIWPVFVAVTIFPAALITPILFFTRNKLIYSLNVLTQRGAHIFYYRHDTVFKYFVAYQYLKNIEAQEEYDGTGTVMFSNGDNQLKFRDILDVKAVVKILEEQVAKYKTETAKPNPTTKTPLLYKSYEFK